MAIFGLPGGSEWLIILGVVLLIFGPTQLPKLAKMFGKSAKAMREGIEGKYDEEDEQKTEKKSTSDDPKPEKKGDEE